MNRGQLLQFLNAHSARPKKSLSQNFLIDPTIVKKIVELAEVKPNDAVLEIGPGPGALTQELLKAGTKVYAVEMDSLFANELPRFQSQDNRLTVFEGDFLTFDLKKLPSPIKVVANLPYHITTPILEQIFKQVNFISITVMVQKEVANRMAAKAGSKDFGLLSLIVQFYSEPKGSFLVPPSSFLPEPEVDSKVIHLEARTPPQVDRVLFFQLLNRAFQQRRKMLSRSLNELIPAKMLQALLGEIGLTPSARPEELSIEKWVCLCNRYKSFIQKTMG
jgi:16S rRNA (adenine1518-N6/adenine1519-N6)-dimethyltransferase